MPPNATTRISTWFDAVLHLAEFWFVFEKNFAKGTKMLHTVRNAANNSLLWLEEMYQVESFMKKLHNQLIFLNVKAPTLVACLYYFQE